MFKTALSAATFALLCCIATTAIAAVPFESLDGLKAGVTTAAEVKAIIGAPENENHNPDGRFIYFYHVAPKAGGSPEEKVIASVVFDKNAKLLGVKYFKGI
ncbi:hypothetical protein [Lysobacter sp. P5_B9]